MRVIIGADHGGFEMKEKAKVWLGEMMGLQGQSLQVVDVGSERLDPDDDYVDYAMKAVLEMKEDDRLVLFCRNGMGMAITANKRKGVRCGLGFGLEAVRKGRTDDDINALAIPADYSTDEVVKEMVKIFLTTEFSKTERYKNRLEKLGKLEAIWSQ